jgi:hypothetical protein
MEASAHRAMVSRLSTARVARRLYLAKLAVSVADGRDIRSSAEALRAEARLAVAVARSRRDEHGLMHDS